MDGCGEVGRVWKVSSKGSTLVDNDGSSLGGCDGAGGGVVACDNVVEVKNKSYLKDTSFYSLVVIAVAFVSSLVEIYFITSNLVN
ncbi:hypothetical protein Tco_0716115 [Tanacetum coccineum]